MNRKNKIFNIQKELAIIVCLFAYISIFSVNNVLGATRTVTQESLPDQKIFNDFVVGPGKFEMELEPGQSGTFEINIVNRLGVDRVFSLSEEDFTGSDDLDQTVVLLGNDRGPYSLKDYISFATTSIKIPHATIYKIPVTVKIPVDSEPGGLYGSIVVSLTGDRTENSETSEIKPVNQIMTRIGTLLFVRVKGPVVEEGKLIKFDLKNDRNVLFDYSSIIFNILYKNEGNIHLSPRGEIKIKNIFGTEVGSVEIEPWFVMPDSLRLREVEWKSPFLFGRYVSQISIYRGDEIKDQMSLVFWVIPWKIVTGLILFALLFYVLFGRIRSRKTKIFIIFLIVISLITVANAESMSSTNYKLEIDSINFAGNRSLSGSYIVEDTLGEISTGISSSTNYILNAGYQQQQTLMISVIPASDVVMSPSIPGLTGGTANGQTTFTVTTDNPAGYIATMNSDFSPALRSSLDSFEDYIPSGAVPDYSFTNDSATSSFAFTPEGVDIAQRFKNSGLVCGVGSDDDVNACWDGLSTDAITIVSRTSSNQPLGTVSVVKFRAESGSNHVQLDGSYLATTTITVTAI